MALLNTLKWAAVRRSRKTRAPYCVVSYTWNGRETVRLEHYLSLVFDPRVVTLEFVAYPGSPIEDLVRSGALEEEGAYGKGRR